MMLNRLLFLAALVLFLAGCASAPRAKSSAGDIKAQAQIRRRLIEVLDAAATKDFERLDGYHYYGPRFTKFSTEGTGRQDAVAAREGEHTGLGAVEHMTMRADDLKIDVFGRVGIATFILGYRFEAAGSVYDRKAQTTMIFVKVGDSWKIAHEHLSSFKSNP